MGIPRAGQWLKRPEVEMTKKRLPEVGDWFRIGNMSHLVRTIIHDHVIDATSGVFLVASYVRDDTYLRAGTCFINNSIYLTINDKYELITDAEELAILALAYVL